VIGADILIDKLSWPTVPVYVLFSASLLGVTGFMILHWLLSGEAKAWVAAKYAPKAPETTE